MSAVRRIRYLLYGQLAFFSLTWLAGIYVNGFVSILPGTSALAIVLEPYVTLHIALASLTLAASLLGVAWTGTAHGRRPLIFLSLATASIVAAGASGLEFILGGASDSTPSFTMAVGFITALFLTFLGALSFGRRLGGAPRSETARRACALLCFVALAACYCVFVSGIYVNLFVTGPVFSLPLDFQLAAFRQAELTGPFLLHEVLGGVLLASLAALAASLWVVGARRLSMTVVFATLLVAYSAYVGSLNITSPLAPTPPGLASVAVPMASAAAFICAIVSTMLVTLSFRGALDVRSDGRKS